MQKIVLPPKSVIVSCIGSDMGKAALTSTACVTNQQVNGIVVDTTRFDPEFLYYNLSQRKAEIRGMAGGSAQPILNKSHFSEITFEAPSLAHQRDVVAPLAALDDKIALLRETNSTLEAIAQALFKSWFVDFDPVRAKVEGRDPEGMPPEVADLFPSEFEDSEQGVIPKGWKAVPFGKLLEFAIGGDWGAEAEDEEHTVPVAIVRGTDIPDLQAGKTDRVPRRFVTLKKLSSRRLADGDIAIEVSGGSKTQPTGRSIYVTDALLGWFDSPVVPTSFCRLLRAKDREISMLLSCHLSFIYNLGKMWNYQVQSTGLANFQTTHFLESELVVLPPVQIREAFFALVRPLIERQHQADIRNLTELRDTLLPRLMSGKLRIPDVEEALA